MKLREHLQARLTHWLESKPTTWGAMLRRDKQILGYKHCLEELDALEKSRDAWKETAEDLQVKLDTQSSAIKAVETRVEELLKTRKEAHCMGIQDALEIIDEDLEEHGTFGRIERIVDAIQERLLELEGEGEKQRAEVEDVEPPLESRSPHSVLSVDCAAALWRGELYFLLRPTRHEELVARLVIIKGANALDIKLGYTLSSGHFVDPITAYRIAYEAGQLLPGVEPPTSVWNQTSLRTEHLW